MNNNHQKMVADFRHKFYISLTISIPILLLSPMIQNFFNFSFTFPGSTYVLFILSTIIFIYGGWPFLSGLYDELKNKNPGMMTLIGMAISIAYFYSSAVVFGLEGRFFFWELATLIIIMLLGHWIEMKSVMGASQALKELVKLMPDQAHLVKGDEIEEIAIKKLEIGDTILIRPGEKIPADGKIIEGSSYINESMLTGESEPIEKNENDQVIGGSINGDSSIKVKVGSAGDDSYLSQVINLVEESQKTSSKTQGLADRAALWLTIIALSAGLVTLMSWLIAGKDLAFSIERMATVMVITCPHALGLAIPLVVAVSTTISARNGLLIRNRTAFENTRKISTVIFDKTGTLTRGEFGVSNITPLTKDVDEEEILKLAASLEVESEHPIARGIENESEKKSLSLYQVEDFSAIKGRGVTGKIDNQEIKVVSPGFLKEKNITLPDSYVKSEEPGTEVFVLKRDDILGTIRLSDQLRTTSKNTISRLQKMGIKCWMLTGDNEETAVYISQQLGLDNYVAEVLPHEKQEKVEELQNMEEFVAMTGDGVNDAPALARADIGIAIGSGTDVAAETADIILVDSDPADVLSLIKFGKATYNKMIQNLVWATGYNAFAIPLAAGVLYTYNFMISPAVGAILMSLSTVIVAFNARLLKIN